MGPLGSYVRDNISINQSATRLNYPEVLNIKVVFDKKNESFSVFTIQDVC